jgi:histidinol phosphatase-like enzyme
VKQNYGTAQLKLKCTRQECWNRVTKKGLLNGVEKSRNVEEQRNYTMGERARDLHGTMKAQEEALQKERGGRVRRQAKRGKTATKIEARI